MSDPADPERLGDAAQPSLLGQLLASAGRDVPSERELARLAERLGPLLEPHGATVTAPRSSLLLKLGVMTGVALVIGGTVLMARWPRNAEELALSSAAAPDASGKFVAAPPPQAIVVPPLASTLTGAASEPPVDAPSLSVPKKTRLESLPTKQGLTEPALLEHARRSLASAPATALALCNEHAARFPHGVLVQEREVIAIEALRRLNRASEAEQRSLAFSKAFPSSAHRRVVEDAPLER